MVLFVPGIQTCVDKYLRKQDDYYFHCIVKLGPASSQMPEGQLLNQIREKYAAEEWWFAANARITDIYTASLILIGGALPRLAFTCNEYQAGCVDVCDPSISCKPPFLCCVLLPDLI